MLDQNLDLLLEDPDLGIEPGQVAGDAGGAARTRGALAGAFHLAEADQLGPAAVQIGQFLPFRVGRRLGCRVERPSHSGEQPGVDRVGLGQSPGGSRKGTGKQRVDPGKRNAGGG